MIQRAKRISLKAKLKKKAFWGKLLAIFFAFMALCTVVSRAADSVIIPKVQLDKPSSGNLNYKIEGKGNVRASEGELVTVPANLRVSEITKPGTNVKAGDALAVIDLDELSKELEEQNDKLDQLRLQLKKEQLGQTPDARTPQTYSAGKNLEIARNHYDEAAAKLDEAVNAENYEAPERQQKADIDKQAAYDAFQAQGVEENAETKAAYDQTVQSIDQELEQAASEKQAQIEALEQNRDAMQDALEQAEAAYEIAQTEDENTNANEQKAKQSSDLTVEGMKIDISQQEKAVKRIQEIMDARGLIKSPAKGTVTENSLSEGLVTSGQEYIRIGTGGYEFLAPVDKENGQRLKEGDSMRVEFAGLKEKKKLKIQSIRTEDSKTGDANGAGKNADGSTTGPAQDQEGIRYITAKIEGDEYTDGMEGAYVIEKESDIRYDWILPIEAIHEDSKGTYCLAARKKNTILGEEYIAERINLVKKEKDLNRVAVEGALTEKTKVITESSKDIEEGDRVRIDQ